MIRSFSPARAAVAAGLLLLAAAAARAAGPLDAALDAFKQGDYAKTVELASAVKPDDANRSKAAYLTGEADLALERWDDAVTAFNEVLTKKADSLPALVGLGRAQTAKGSADDAITTLEKAVKLDAKDVAARRSLGEARTAKGDLEKAKADLQAAIKLDPKDALSSRSLVDVHLRAEKFDWALSEADRFAKLAPDHPMGHFLRGLVLDRQAKDKDAIEAYEKAISKDDKFIDAHKNLAILCIAKSNTYQDRDRVKKAFDHFARYFELGGKDAELKALYEQIRSFLEANGLSK
jgi:tetratricopeptide (TPR) repeat protein